MPQFLTTIKTSAAIEDIIQTAKKEIVLISPYLKISNQLLHRLKDASFKKVPIKIIFRQKDLKDSEFNQLTSIEGVELYNMESLHAKCYYNESKLAITSMNMYEFSEKQNREMGILLNSEEDEAVFVQAVEEANSIFRASTKIVLQKPVQTKIADSRDFVSEQQSHVSVTRFSSFNDFYIESGKANLSNWKQIVTLAIKNLNGYKWSDNYEHEGKLIFRARPLNISTYFSNTKKGKYYINKLEGTAFQYKAIEQNISFLMQETGAIIKVYTTSSGCDIIVHVNEQVDGYGFENLRTSDLDVIIRTFSVTLFVQEFLKAITDIKQEEAVVSRKTRI